MNIVYKDFNIDLNRHTFLADAILVGMNPDIAESEPWKLRQEMVFELKVNGIEHNLTIFLKRLEDKIDKEIEVRARRIVEDKFSSLMQTVSAFEYAFKEQTENILREDYK